MCPEFTIQFFSKPDGERFCNALFNFLKRWQSDNFKFDFDGELDITLPAPVSKKIKRRSATDILLDQNAEENLNASKIPKSEYHTRLQQSNENEKIEQLQKEVRLLRKTLRDKANEEDDDVEDDEEFLIQNVHDLQFLESVIVDGCIKKISAQTLRISYKLILQVFIRNSF